MIDVNMSNKINILTAIFSKITFTYTSSSNMLKNIFEIIYFCLKIKQTKLAKRNFKQQHFLFNLKNKLKSINQN